ncbi:hypothetical protein [Providencia sp. PROV130]|nr:hypothetical protein [Providencia sp. PROV130]
MTTNQVEKYFGSGTKCGEVINLALFEKGLRQAGRLEITELARIY